MIFRTDKIIKKEIFSDIIVHLIFCVLFIYALVYYKERLFSDSAYYIFKVINYKSFWVEHNRFILIFSQLLPLIAVFSGLSLKNILIIYSIGNVLFFYFLFFVSRYYLKDKFAGILLILLQTIGILWGFYVPMFELYYGSGLLVLFAIILSNDSDKFLNLLILCILEILILTSHPFGFLLFIFVLLFHFLKTKFRPSFKYWIFLIFLIITLIFKKYTISDYESAKSKSFFETLHNGIFDLDYLKSLIIFLLNYYKEILIIFIVTSVYLISKKHFIGFIIYFFSFIFFLIIINISNYGFVHSRYQEQVYFPLVFVVTFPFYKYVLSGLKGYLYYLVILFTFLLIITRVIQIQHEVLKFSHRIDNFNYLIQHCQSLTGKKFIIREENVANENSIDLNWSFPIETMLISGLSPSHKTITICSENDIISNNKSNLTNKNFLFRTGEIFEDKTLNQKYFRINDGAYYELNKNAVIPVDSELFLSKIKIMIKNNIKKIKHSSCIYFPIIIFNKNTTPVYSSTTNNIYICYHWKKDNKIEELYEFRTPVMADIYKNFSQDIIIYSPDKQGQYTLSIDMLIENKKWLNIKCQTVIEIN